MVELFITVDRGLERLVVDDLKDLNIGIKIKMFRTGKIFIEGSYDHVFMLNFICRSINRVFLQLEHTTISNLHDIKEIVNDIDWTRYISPKRSFAVDVNRVGNHDFSSMDIKKLVGAIIQSKYQSNYRPKVRLHDPDIRVFLDIQGNDLLIGIDTTGPSLHMRRYRVFNHPKALKTTIAYLMIKFSEWVPNKPLIDPTCGGGTIPIEAALYARNIPIFMFRGNEYSFYKLDFLPLDHAEKIQENLLNQINDIKCPLYCIELNRRYFDGAIKNAKNAKVIDTINFIYGDFFAVCADLERLFDFAVFNPPYKIKGNIVKFYYRLLTKILNIMTDDFTIVLITARTRILKKILKDMSLHYEISYLSRKGYMDTGIFKIKQHID